MKSVYAILICCLIYGCDPVDRRLTIINNSSRTITCILSNCDSIKVDSYSDTNAFQLNPDSNHHFSIIIGGDLENTLRSLFKNGKIYVFIVDADTLKKHYWNGIIKGKNYLKIDSSSIDALKKNNWEIVYKGSK